MEFYLHNKDDRKLKTLVNLATTFNLNGINYIIYYNTQVEKSVIDIYIGKISYGNQCLVINKIDAEEQNNFLTVVKEILAAKNPETEISDYINIIGTATIVLESVQKIQIPTNSLDNLKKYNKKEEVVVENQENVSEEYDEEAVNDYDMFNEKEDNSEDNIVDSSDVEIDSNISNNSLEENVHNDESLNNNVGDNNSFISSNDSLSKLDNLLNERQEKDKVKSEKKKLISTPILVLLILTLIIAGILFVIGEFA